MSKGVRAVLGLIILLVPLAATAQDRSPLRDYRARFVNQRIIINGDFVDRPVPFLGDWQFTVPKGDTYVADYSRQVPTKFVGRTGTIIAVVAPQRVMEPPPSQADDAYVAIPEAIVKLDIGEIVQTALYSVYLHRDPGSEPSDAFTMASVREHHQQEAAALARQLAGKSLYLMRLTKVFDPGLTVANIETLKAGVGHSEAQITNVPLLTPLPVLETRYSTDRDFTLVTLQLPNGRKALYVLGCVADKLGDKNYACASTTMPPMLTPREIEAIRKGAVFVGMSDIAVYMTMGVPKDTNKAAVGTTQLVYASAYIYLDANKKVVEIQSQR